jgi:hypothetical protein
MIRPEPLRTDTGSSARAVSITRGIVALGRGQTLADASEFAEAAWPEGGGRSRKKMRQGVADRPDGLFEQHVRKY